MNLNNPKPSDFNVINLMKNASSSKPLLNVQPTIQDRKAPSTQINPMFNQANQIPGANANSTTAFLGNTGNNLLGAGQLDPMYGPNPVAQKPIIPPTSKQLSNNTKFIAPPVQNNRTNPMGNNGNYDNNTFADAGNFAMGIPSQYAQTWLGLGQNLAQGALNQQLMGQGMFQMDPNASKEQIMHSQNLGGNFFEQQFGALNQMKNYEDKSKENQTLGTNGDENLAWLNTQNLGSIQNKKDVLATYQSATPEMKQQILKQVALDKLPTTKKDAYINREVQSEKLQNIFDYVESNPSLKTNLYKQKWNSFQSILAKSQDPGLVQLNAMIGEITGGMINQYYGAVLAANEETRANKYIPNLERDTIGDMLIKMENLKKAGDMENETTLRASFGGYNSSKQKGKTGQSGTGGFDF